MRASVSNKFLVDSNGQSWPCPISRARAPRAPMKRWNLRTADSVSSPVNRHRRSSKRTSMAWRKRISSGGERPAGSFKRCRWPTVGASVRSQLMKIRTTSRPGVTFRRATYPINPKRSTSQDLFDTFYDRRNGFMFQTNPLGALRDQQFGDEGQAINRDWNTVWDVKASTFEQGWIVEIAVPFKFSPVQGWEGSGLEHQYSPRGQVEERGLLPVPHSLPRQRSSPHLRPDDRLVTIDRVLHHASLGVA